MTPHTHQPTSLTTVKRFILTSGALAIVTVALAGCAPVTPSADPSSSAVPSAQPSQSPVATPTPTPTPTPTKPTLSELALTPDGLGPLKPGAAVPHEPASIAIVAWNPNACAGTGEWLATYPRQTTGDDIHPFSFASGSKNDPIRLLTVWTSDIKTAEGIGVGSTAAEVAAAYPQIVPVHGDVSDLYTLKGATGELVFEVPTAMAANPAEWPKSALGTVVWEYLDTAGTKAFSETTLQGGADCYD